MLFAAPVRVPALRGRIGRFGGFVEPRPARMSARSRLRLPGPSGPFAPAARHPRPRRLVFLRVRLVVKTRPRVAWTLLKRSLPLPGGFGSSGVRWAVPGTGPSAPPHPSSPRPRDNPCLVSPSASRVFGGLGLRLFSRAESGAQLLLSADSASPFPRIIPGSRNPGAQLSAGAGLGVA